MFLMFILDNILKVIAYFGLFLSKSDVVKRVWQAFENYVTV